MAGQHGRLECLKLLHAKLGEQMDIVLKLQKADTENPYLSTDKVRFVTGFIQILLCKYYIYRKATLFFIECVRVPREKMMKISLFNV